MKSPKKRVKMLLDNNFQPDVRVYKEARFLVERGYDVEIIAMDKKNEKLDKQDEVMDGIKVHRLYPRSKYVTGLINKYKIISKFKMFIYFIWLIKFGCQTKTYLKKDSAYCYLHCHDLMMAALAAIILKDKLLVFDMHEYYLKGDNSKRDWMLQKILTYTQNKAAYIIYVNNFQLKGISEENRRKCIELPNYPDIHLFKEIDKTVTSKIRIAYIGAARDYMSLKFFIDASCNPDFEFRIHGIGSSYQELKKYAESIGKNEILTGTYDGINDIEMLYRNTDILYCVYQTKSANWQSAYPVKFFEAILTCTPIIVNEKAPYAKMVIDKRIGFCIDAEDPEALPTLLGNITIETLAEMKKNLYDIRFDYTWDKKVCNLLEIYKNDEVEG